MVHINPSRAWRSFAMSELRGPVDWSGAASKEPTKFTVGLPGAESAKAAPDSSAAASTAADAVNAAVPKGRKG